MRYKGPLMLVAVTGATGFIGRYVLRELARRGVSTVATTRGPVPESVEFASVKWVSCNVRDARPDLFEMLGRPDVLIHLAWGGLPNYRSRSHFDSELPSHYRFLHALLTGGLQSLVVSGTCFEYGMQDGQLSEERLAQPHLAYPFAKHALRCQLEFLKEEYPFALAWARLFYMYGNGQNPKSLHAQLMAAIDRGDTSFDMSAGDQLRDFSPVEDVARKLVALALVQADVGVVNVCSGRPQSVRSLVEGWVQEANAPIRLNLGHYPYSDYEPMAFWGDDRKLNAVLQPPQHPSEAK